MNKRYAFWNNKGGTGKTSLAFQTICEYVRQNPTERILTIDICPQGNLSELMLGGLANNGSQRLLQRHNMPVRCSLGGYFQLRLPSPYAPPPVNPYDFITNPSGFNQYIPSNIHLVCGDPLLEIQSNAINTLSTQNIPGFNAWINVIDWLEDFLRPIQANYDVVFMDCNPSFSIYTQIALATANRIVAPVMADDSSRRALQNALSLVYGLSLPSPIYASYAFSNKLAASNRALPQIHLIVKNRITQYMGDASAYAAVLNEIERDVAGLVANHPGYFTFTNPVNGFVSVRDFQTTGVVAFAKGLPFIHVNAGKQSIGGHRVQVKADYLANCRQAIEGVASRL